jgi:hypothetical protein
MRGAMTNLRQVPKVILINVLVGILLFLIVEGLASVLNVGRDVIANRPLSERQHTQYDPEIGWINKANVYVRDMYGPGVFLRTNSALFRNSQEFSRAVPEGKVRALCSGDSFTLGYGVSNDHTWCQLLTAIDPRLETVNLGQGGYGVDQAYLWYKRNSLKLEHDVHLFAFITGDFERMESDVFLGYPKPILAMDQGQLVTRNVPLPRRAFYVPWVTQNADAINRLNSIQLFRRMLFAPSAAASDTVPHVSPREHNDYPTREVALAVFKDLLKISEATGSTLVLIHLPHKRDHVGNESASWRKFLKEEAAKAGIIYIDLIEEFRALPSETMETLFIPEGVSADPHAARHYTEAGNRYVAQALHRRLLELPGVW